MHDTAYLYDTLGRRLYLTAVEREAFLRTTLGHDRPVRTFCSLLYYSGCRIWGFLHIPAKRFNPDSGDDGASFAMLGQWPLPGRWLSD